MNDVLGNMILKISQNELIKKDCRKAILLKLNEKLTELNQKKSRGACNCQKYSV